MELKRIIENRYRHYKGGIYYKLCEALCLNNIHSSSLEEEKVYDAIYEPDGSEMEVTCILRSHEDIYDYYVNFKDEPEPNPIFNCKVIVYQSEDTGTVWVRLKEEFEGFNEQGIKRFTLANK